MKKWDFSDIQTWNWKQVPEGGIIPDTGTAEEYNTGSWRSLRPVFDPEKCTNCLNCFIFCPDAAIRVEDGKMVGFDYFHCKGCGICANQCNFDAIKMVPQQSANRGENA